MGNASPPFMQPAFPLQSLVSVLGVPTGKAFLAYINIRDTAPHSYRTDLAVPYLGSQYGIAILKLGNTVAPIRTYAIWVFNNENQPVTVTPLANIVGDGSLPDALYQSYTVGAGSADIHAYPFMFNPTEYLSLQLQFATAPTGPANPALPTGIYALLLPYYGV